MNESRIWLIIPENKETLCCAAAAAAVAVGFLTNSFTIVIHDSRFVICGSRLLIIFEKNRRISKFRVLRG